MSQLITREVGDVFLEMPESKLSPINKDALKYICMFSCMSAWHYVYLYVYASVCRSAWLSKYLA